MNKKFLIIMILLIFIILSMNGCTENETSIENVTSENGNDFFNYPPVDLSKVAFIEPMGSMIGNHVTPIDHQYYPSTDFFEGQEMKIDVYSPGEGTITNIQHMGSFDSVMDDYRIVIQHTDMVSSVFIHVDNLSDKIVQFAPPDGGYISVNIPVSAGEIIGNYSGSVDYNIVDYNIILPGFVNPESYEAEPWKIHTPDPFDYFNNKIKTQLIDKCLRSETPFGGKIDHDIDGRLVGNWFLEGTNGYGGLEPENYWIGHLAISYNSVDPDHVIVSFGSYQNEPRQFAVKENKPDPANISIESGLVKYELVDYDFYNASIRWDRESLVKGLKIENYDNVHGVVLFQLNEDRKLKVEIFPDKRAQDVSGFTENALIYVR
ncbi:MAG: hypothetical protein AYK22_02570 [Thermoplasmatales archaeon SG8-52-3]|nr:MAG: hypothetical protein AYK22_02570 [Thermoplasmatales archaeon SG8-52-3]